MVRGLSISSPEGDAGEDVSHLASAIVENKQSRAIAVKALNGGDDEAASDIDESSLSAKQNEWNMIVDRGNDTNFMLIVQDSTSHVVGGGLTRRDTADGSQPAILVTASRGIFYQRRRNSQSHRGEQQADEKGELGDHGGDDGADNERERAFCHDLYTFGTRPAVLMKRPLIGLLSLGIR